MDNELTVFQRHHRRVELAMQEWLLRWQLPEWPGITCPRCQAESFGKLGHHQGRKTHICKTCRYTFSLDEVSGCQCTVPGYLLKCSSCKHYLNMSRYIERRMPELRKLPDEAIRQRFDPTRYGLRDMTRPNGQGQPSQIEEEAVLPNDVVLGWTQLTLLDVNPGNGANEE